MKRISILLALVLAAGAGGAQQPVTQTITAIQLPYDIALITFSGGGSRPEYQWFRDGKPLAGETGITYRVPAAEYPNSDSRRCAVGTATHTYVRGVKCETCPAGWLYDDPVTLTICAEAALPVATLSTDGSTVGRVTFTATATSGARYSWSLNGAAFGAWDTIATHTLSTATQATHRAAVRVKGSNGCVSAAPVPATAGCRVFTGPR